MSARSRRCPVGKRIWQLQLYVAGETPRTRVTRANLREICERHLKGRYRLRVVDVLQSPDAAKMKQIVVIPTLVRSYPKPVRRLVGTFSDLPRSLAALDLVAEGGP